MLKWSKRNLRKHSQVSISKLAPPGNSLVEKGKRSNTSSSNKHQDHSFSLRSSKSDKTRLEKMMEQMMQQMGDFKKDLTGMKQEMTAFKASTMGVLEELKEWRVQSKNNASQ